MVKCMLDKPAQQLKNVQKEMELIIRNVVIFGMQYVHTAGKILNVKFYVMISRKMKRTTGKNIILKNLIQPIEA